MPLMHRRRLGPFDLEWCHRDAIALFEHLVFGGRLAVHADEVVLRLPALDLAAKKVLDRGPLRDLDIVRKTATIIVNEQNSHCFSPIYMCVNAALSGGSNSGQKARHPRLLNGQTA